jgi:hypothetical protein
MAMTGCDGRHVESRAEQHRDGEVPEVVESDPDPTLLRQLSEVVVDLVRSNRLSLEPPMKVEVR